MAIIRPCADLRNKYNEISKICHETNKPIYITKNGYNDLVLLSTEAYEEYEEEKINKLIIKHFNEKFSDIETLKKDFCEKILTAIKQVDEGKCIPSSEFFKEMEEKYNIHE